MSRDTSDECEQCDDHFPIDNDGYCESCGHSPDSDDCECDACIMVEEDDDDDDDDGQLN